MSNIDEAQFAVYETDHTEDSFVTLFKTEKDMKEHLRQDVQKIMKILLEDGYTPIYVKTEKRTTVTTDETPEIFYIWEPCPIL